MKLAFGFAIAITLTLMGSPGGRAQHVRYSLESTAGLRLHNVAAKPAVLAGKKGLRITVADETLRRFQGMTDEELNEIQARVGQYAVIENAELSDGSITAEIAGAPAPGSGSAARGFVGIGFRLENGAYDLFNLRFTNGRADEQTRRNHAAQYSSLPNWPWFRLREETPSRYESYVDLQTDVWTMVRIDVHGDRAQLYVHGQEQPSLIVNDLKSGTRREGKVALWINHGTVAYFRNLTVQPYRQ